VKFLEIILIIVACVFAFMFIKYLLKKILLALFILGFSGVISFIYKIPYSISVLSISILIYSIKSISLEVKHMSGNLIKSRRLYLNGWHEKMVNLLFSVNYIVFMGICYMMLMRVSFSIIDTMELVIAFCLTWICIWIVGHSRFVLFKCIDSNELEIQ
jgi:hypothetical protein